MLVLTGDGVGITGEMHGIGTPCCGSSATIVVCPNDRLVPAVGSLQSGACSLLVARAL